MANLNSVTMIGNIVRICTKYTSGGMEVCEFSMAMNRKYKDKEEVCYLDIVAYSKMAEICGKYLNKGDPVCVQGRLKQDTWESKTGEKRSKHLVICENVVLLGGGDKQREQGGANTPPPEDEIPF